MAVKTIVVALALDDGSRRVADRAVQLANDHDARLVGVHVLETLHPAGLPPSLDAQALTALVRNESEHMLRSLLEASGRPFTTVVEAGKPHVVIETLAASQDADLIVIGPGVAASLREKVFGSTADRVVRYAPCPVLVAKNSGAAPYGRIAVGVDFSDCASAAAAFASELAPAARRDLIHAIEIPLVFEQAMLKAGTSRQEIERYRRAKARLAREQMLEAFGEDGRLPGPTRLRIVQGDPAAALLNASRRAETDLVALGTQGLNAVARHLLGSVARKVLAGSRCDVLVVPATAVDPRPDSG